MKHLTQAFAACLTLLSVPFATAATEQEHVLVTDRHAPKRDSISEVDLANYTGFVQVIDRDQFAHRFTDITDLLDTLPGIQVKQLGGLGGLSSIAIRGSGGKQVSVFLDGLLLNNPDSGSASVGDIPTVLIDRIEAYPDFTPVQLGNANLAGAINFRSRQLRRDDSGARVSLSAGSFDTRHSEVSGWGNFAHWEVIAGLNYTEADNDFPVYDELFRTDSRRRQNDGYRQHSSFLKVGRDQSNGRLSALLQHSKSEKEVASALNQQRDNATLDKESLRVQAVRDYRLGSVDLAHRGFVTRNTTQFSDANSTIGLGEDRVESEYDSFGLYNTARWQGQSLEWVAGLELRRDSIEVHDLLRQRMLTETRRDTAVLALANNWSAGDNLLVSTAVRHYLQDDHIDFSLSGDNSDSTLAASSAQLGVQWRRSSSLTFKANIGRLLRLPTLTENFGAEGLLYGNPSLSQERAFTGDAGFDWQRGTLSSSASVFYREVDDAIITIYDSRGVGQPQNIGSSVVAGVETDLDWRALKWLSVRASATLIDSENQSNIRSAKGKQLPGIYHQSIGSGLTLSLGHSRVELDYVVHNELFYNPANAVEADRKEELSLSFSHFWRRVTVDVAARNLLDKNFLDANRFPTPGRSVTATLTLSL